MKLAGYFVVALFAVGIAYVYFGLNGALIAATGVFILGAFFVLQTQSLVHFYVEAAPALSRIVLNK